jgi:hypothetical protein
VETRSDGNHATEYGDRASHVAGEVERVRTQGRGLICAGCAERHGDARSVDQQRYPDDHEHVPAGLQITLPARQPDDRFDHDEHPAGEQDPGLAERSEVLGAPVSVWMVAVGRAHPESDREERQDRGDDVAGRLDARRDETQATRDDPRAELQRDEHGRGRDRDERGARLGCAPGGFSLAGGDGRLGRHGSR